jgi:vacuolar protein sorting-associated protein 13A/C
MAIAASLNHFNNGIGVITKPVEGVQKGGFLGFFKGTGEGLAGLVAKPVSGTLNAVSKVAEGVTNTIKPISNGLYKASEDKLGPPRFRHPRLFYGRNKQIKAYSNDDILGHQIICNYKDGKFSQESVWIDSFVWNTQNQQPLKKESIGSFQDNAGYLMLIFDISLVFLVNLTQKKIVWVIAANDIDIAADLVNGILIKLKSSDKKIEVLLFSFFYLLITF